MELATKSRDPVSYLLWLIDSSPNQRNNFSTLTRSLQSMSLNDGDTTQDIIPATQVKSPPLPTESHTRKQPPPKSAFGLPALNSNEWGFEDISLPPGPTNGKS